MRNFRKSCVMEVFAAAANGTSSCGNLLHPQAVDTPHKEIDHLFARFIQFIRAVLPDDELVGDPLVHSADARGHSIVRNLPFAQVGVIPLNAYGLTECTAAITFTHQSDGEEKLTYSVGKSISCIEMVLKDDDRNIVP
jgi:hypothetical protein